MDLTVCVCVCVQVYINSDCCIVSILIHPHVVPDLCDFLSSLEPKRCCFEECWEPNNIEAQKTPETFPKTSSFVFHRRKKVIQL